MKTNINSNGMWWSYTETCDKCGKLIFGCEVLHSEKPDINEADFCVECLRHFLDNNISYESIKQYYAMDCRNIK